MTKATWHSGPPPSLGWWPASSERFENSYRWWNGVYWSRPCFNGEPGEIVALFSAIPSTFDLSEIEWQRRPASWPERSRT